MMNILKSNATSKNSKFPEVPRAEGQDNLSWLAAQMKYSDQRVSLVLLGGVDTVAFRLRVAQSNLRHDLTPSHWSHVALIESAAPRKSAAKKTGADSLASTRIYEISLDPPAGFGFAPPTNGVQRARLGNYRDPEKFPNIAVLSVPAAWKDVEAAIVDKFMQQRAVLDATELIVTWLAFLWGVGRAVNPLTEGFGLPSAAMLEVVLGALGYDLTPGLESRSSCPEAIYQSGLWWHEYYKNDDEQKVMQGAWFAPHRLL